VREDERVSELGPAPGGWRRSAAEQVIPVDWLHAALAWKQPAFGRASWELWTERERLATADRHGFLVTRWEIVGPAGAWELRRDWRGRRWIGRPGDSEPAAAYEPGWRGGRIRLRDSTRLVWKRVSLWRREWVIANEEAFPFMRFKAHLRALRVEGSVEFDESARRLADPEPLVLLGWILILDARRRRHAH
jgi:hypothetical protein